MCDCHSVTPHLLLLPHNAFWERSKDGWRERERDEMVSEDEMRVEVAVWERQKHIFWRRWVWWDIKMASGCLLPLSSSLPIWETPEKLPRDKERGEREEKEEGQEGGGTFNKSFNEGEDEDEQVKSRRNRTAENLYECRHSEPSADWEVWFVLPWNTGRGRYAFSVTGETFSQRAGSLEVCRQYGRTQTRETLRILKMYTYLA